MSPPVPPAVVENDWPTLPARAPGLLLGRPWIRLVTTSAASASTTDAACEADDRAA